MRIEREVAVFDTSVLLSGVVFGRTPKECIDLARHGTVEGVTCREILDELIDKLIQKFHFTTQDVVDVTADLLTFLRMVSITNTLRVIAGDPKDDKILECAVDGGATHIVTGDRRHLLPLGSYQNVQIISVSQFLTLVQTQ